MGHVEGFVTENRSKETTDSRRAGGSRRNEALALDNKTIDILTKTNLHKVV